MKESLIWSFLVILTVHSSYATQRPLHHRYYQLFTGGISQLVYDDILISDVSHSLINHPGISKSCSESLSSLREKFDSGSLFPFKFLDSSSKAPSSVLEGTTTSYGDYDECLDIGEVDSPNLSGQYCLVWYDVDRNSTIDQDRPNERSNLQVEEELKTIFPVANFYTPLSGLCLPMGCSIRDVRVILESPQVLSSVNHRLLDVSHCDSRDSIKFRKERLSSHQLVSLIFVGALGALAFIGTLLDLLGIQILQHHSVVYHFVSLLEPNNSNRIDIADIIKMIFAVYGVAVHSIIAVVTPIGVYAVTRLLGIVASVTTIWLQPLINVHGLHVVSFLGGFAMAFSTYPAVNRGNRSKGSISLILERWVRNAPGLFCLLAVEFLWPLAGSGPLYTYIGQDILDNCHKNWWRNVLFITNYNPVMENCMNHTFWSSIDFQLFFVGLGIILLMKRSTILGITAIVVVGLSDFLITGMIAHTYQTTHAMASHPITVDGVVRYIDYIHNQTTNYLFTFVVGLSVGIYIATGRNTRFVGTPGLLISMVFILAGGYSTILYNNFGEYVDRKYIPLFLAGVKIFWASSNALTILYFTYTPPSHGGNTTKEGGKEAEKEMLKPAPPKKDSNQNNNNKMWEGEEEQFEELQQFEEQEQNLSSQNSTDEKQTPLKRRNGSDGDKSCPKEENENRAIKGSDPRKSSHKGSKPQLSYYSQLFKNEATWFYRGFLAISRLSTSLYLVNYWFIRWDFFTVRVPFETSLISFLKRFGYAVVFSELLALVFYCVLLAPVDSYRRMLMSKRGKEKEE